MANTSDGGKGDPPDPSNAYNNTDARSFSPPPVRSPKNNHDLTGIDRDNKFFVHVEDDDDVQKVYHNIDISESQMELI